jgi:hypothetical protein
LSREYIIKRSVLNHMKKNYGMQDVGDYDFLQWWRRNHGTGYEINIKIIERR